MALRVDRIYKLMEEKGLNQRELADRVGTTEVTISRYLNDSNKSPRVEILARIAKVLGESIEYLIEPEVIDDVEILEQPRDIHNRRTEESYKRAEENRLRQVQIENRLVEIYLEVEELSGVIAKGKVAKIVKKLLLEELRNLLEEYENEKV